MLRNALKENLSKIKNVTYVINLVNYVKVMLLLAFILVKKEKNSTKINVLISVLKTVSLMILLTKILPTVNQLKIVCVNNVLKTVTNV